MSECRHQLTFGPVLALVWRVEWQVFACRCWYGRVILWLGPWVTACSHAAVPGQSGWWVSSTSCCSLFVVVILLRVCLGSCMPRQLLCALSNHGLLRFASIFGIGVAASLCRRPVGYHVDAIKRCFSVTSPEICIACCYLQSHWQQQISEGDY